MLRRIVYPVEPGFVWLLRNGRLWGGWDEPPQGGTTPKKVAKIVSAEEVLEIYFVYANGWSGKIKWAGKLKAHEAQYFDAWEIANIGMNALEALCLKILLEWEYALEPNGRERPPLEILVR